MSDYGIKVSKDERDAYSSNAVDFLMNTKYPFAKIDPTNLKSLQTTTVNIKKNTTDNVKTEVYRFEHGYDYVPQLWGIWEVTYGSIIDPSMTTKVGYESFYMIAGIGANVYVNYGVDNRYVYLYITRDNPFGLFPSDVTGTVMKLTTYVFVDELVES